MEEEKQDLILSKLYDERQEALNLYKNLNEAEKTRYKRLFWTANVIVLATTLALLLWVLSANWNIILTTILSAWLIFGLIRGVFKSVDAYYDFEEHVKKMIRKSYGPKAYSDLFENFIKRR